MADDDAPRRPADDPSAALCRALAEVLATPDGLRAARRAQQAGRLEGAVASALTGRPGEWVAAVDRAIASGAEPAAGEIGRGATGGGASEAVENAEEDGGGLGTRALDGRPPPAGGVAHLAGESAWPVVASVEGAAPHAERRAGKGGAGVDSGPIDRQPPPSGGIGPGADEDELPVVGVAEAAGPGAGGGAGAGTAPFAGPEPLPASVIPDAAEGERPLGGAGSPEAAAASPPAPAAPGSGAVPAALAGPRPISIWRPATTAAGETVWERPAPAPLGDHYSPRRRLEPRRAPLPRRVVVLGESVAAGYLYAPHLTAALALAARLRDLAGDGAWEVIDLARSDETLAGLAATAEAAGQLAPDVLVVFAGNNWNLLETAEVSAAAPSVADRQAFAAVLAAHGPPGPVGLARRRLDERARDALDRLAAAARAAGAGVVAVIPEVNLGDWESRQPVLWLPGDGVARWYDLLAAALAALARGDAAAAEAAAWRMSRLDGSTNPVPFRLLARAWALAGREADARDAALAEVDSVHYPLLGFLAAPQATTAARDLLADAARRHGWAAVDLRRVFAEHTGALLPGRRLFLDYCHLTAEAMDVAMAAAAVEVARRAPAPGLPDEASWRELLRGGPGHAVSAAAEATARLGAALHGAHRLLPVEESAGWVEAWCDAALAASPGVAAAMAELAAARTASGPAVLTAAVRANQAGAHALGFQHGLVWDGLDGEVLLAAARALRRAGRREAAEIERRLAALAPPPAGLDLAAGPRWLAEPLARPFPEAIGADPRATLRCPWPASAFWLPLAAGRPHRLRLTARLPPIPGVETERRGTVRLEVDGRPAGEAPLAGSWSRHEIRLPPPPTPGLHRLTLRWPPPPPVGTAALEGARRRLEVGVEADLHPLFGEVAALRVWAD